MEIEHFSHHHTLFLSDEKEGCGIPCNGCSQPITGLTYCCKQCVFILHKWCAELPHEIQDERHPEHVLTLLPKGHEGSSSDDFTCDQCHEDSSGFRFSCSECSFNIHVECASYVRMHRVGFMISGNHHEFSYLRVMPLADRSYTCSACGYPGSGSWFECEGKKLKLHVQCATLPKTAKHATHRHALTFTANLVEEDSNSDEFYCDACEEERDPKHWVYHCSKGCSFVAHISCANSPVDRLVQSVKENPLYESAKHRPIDPQREAIENSLTETFRRAVEALDNAEKRNEERIRGEDFELELQYAGHHHPLVLHDEPFNEVCACEVCFTGTYGKTYICKDCKYYLHKWCSNLPQQIQHLLHHEHPLTLTPSHYTWQCHLCKSGDNFHTGYHCSDCNVSLHVLCAALPRNLKHELHEHALTPVCCAIDRVLYKFSGSIFAKRYGPVPPCNICGFPCDQLSLECADCDFHIHIHCFLLPITGKHMTHRHELVLGPPPDWESNSDEFYCDACEEERNSRSWAYYCPKCAEREYLYAAHIDCVTSPTLISSQGLEHATTEAAGKD